MTTKSLADEDSSPRQLPDEYADLTATIRELVKVMREGSIGRLEVKRGDLEIELVARDDQIVTSGTGVRVTPEPVDASSDGAAPEEADGYVITSPMIGTFYAAPAPGERPFVQVGDTVEVGQTVAIIEAMKIMNEIVAEVAGTVVEIMVQDAEPVEYGHALMRIQPADEAE